MPGSTSPRLFLTADSRPLYANDAPHARLWAAVRAALGARDPIAAYIGAANGDAAEFYGVFEGAMAAAGIASRRQVTARFTPAEHDDLAAADLIVLSGGDPERGSRVLRATGMRDVLLARYGAGAVLLGVSAGAVQLGQSWWGEGLGLVPYLVDVHDEAAGWARLRAAVSRCTAARGLGIPFGAAAAITPTGAVIDLVGRTVHP